MTKNLTVVYKLASRFHGRLSSEEVSKVHLLHAEDNDDKVLFTTNKAPAKEKQRFVQMIIITTADGSYAVTAHVVQISNFSNSLPPQEYRNPSLWNNERQDVKTWFALTNVKEITGGLQRGSYKCCNSGKDILDSISGAANMVYVE